MLEYFASDVTAEVERITTPTLDIAPLAPGEPRPDVMREIWRAPFAPSPKVTVVFFENSGEFITEDSAAALDRAVEEFLAGKPVEGKAGGAEQQSPPPGTGDTPRPAPQPGGGEPKAPLVHPVPDPNAGAPPNPKPEEPK
jgi:hypothetical protein